MALSKKSLRVGLWAFLVLFLALNVIAVFHSYKFTHFVAHPVAKTKSPHSLSALDKVKTLLLGVNNPRPQNSKLPERPFQTIYLESNRTIECWSIKVPQSKGTVIIYHGFGGQKSSMLDKSEEFIKLGYSTLLVDFMGSGGSEGNQTTVGFLEAAQVKTSYDYLKASGEKNIFLFGTSMGAVAILKAIKDHDLSPRAIVLECPFGTMYETVSARFRMMQVPAFPLADLLVFWGGVQNGYWAFAHNPEEYATHIKVPTLLLYGAQDKKVSKQEIDKIFFNLAGEKQLKVYPQAGHENYLSSYRNDWVHDVQTFLTAL